MERWGWYPFNLERGREEMETGRTSLNFIAATLPRSNSLCISQCSIIFLFKLRIYFITVLRLYWPAWIFGHRIERKEKFWQKRYQYFRKKSEEKNFKRHFNMQLKIVNPHSVPTFSCLHTDVEISCCWHFLICLLPCGTGEVSLLGMEKITFPPCIEGGFKSSGIALCTFFFVTKECLICLPFVNQIFFNLGLVI